ncbi:vWA domain-containing protein [Chondromyces apiculatus]|uniref:vWA domain-containing protein n=1 Tax=Chondromyces apiculatus TaxID=51 RepID=UPI001E464222|nr:vWA domain-containing protein [Chondromyces apiculatus]
MLVAVGMGACSAAGDNETPGGSGAGAGSGNPTSSSSGIFDNTTGGNQNGGSFGGEVCGASTFANLVPASILVLLDKSGSMSGGDGEPNKWNPTRQALIAMMNGADNELSMGLLPFPKGDFNDNAAALCFLNPAAAGCAELIADGGCQDVAVNPAVGVAPLHDSREQITSWLNGASPKGNTPTLVALQRAYQMMRNVNAFGERYVLLMTDGEPTLALQNVPGIPPANLECKTEADIEAEALAAANGSPPVKTFVIGAPGSEGASDLLSQIAINGQTQRSPTCSAAAGDCHYQIGTSGFQQELEAVLNEIAGKVSDCVFEIPQGTAEVDPTLVNVVLETASGTTETYRDTSHQSGWDYTDASQTKIQLHGETCEAYQAEEGAKVNIILGCKTVIQ